MVTNSETDLHLPEKDVTQAIGICDTTAAQCTEKQRQAMTDAFITASRLEFLFWDSAYYLKKWQ